MIKEVGSESEMRQLGQTLGRKLAGGEVFELVGDVGAGKTTLTKGIAQGLDINEPVQSPTFTIGRVYEGRDDLELRHYDFYRLNEAGIMADELAESLESSQNITVVEWGDVVEGVLPEDRLRVKLSTIDEFVRLVEIEALGDGSRRLLQELGL